MVTPIIGGSSVSQLARKTGGISRTVADLASEPGDAGEYADEFQAAFDANAETLRQYANDRLDAGEAVVAIRFADRQGNRARRFLVTSTGGSAGAIEEARVVGPQRFEDLDRSVDRRVALDWYLSRNAADELETFVEKFAARDRDPSQAYVARTAAKYGDSVEGDLVDRLVDRFEGT